MPSYVLAMRGVIKHEKVGQLARHYPDVDEDVDNIIVGQFFESLGTNYCAENSQFEFSENKTYGIFWRSRALCNWIRSLAYMVGCDMNDPSTFDKTTPFFEIFIGGPDVIYGAEVCAKLAMDFAVWEAQYVAMTGGGDVGYKWIHEAFEFAKYGGAVSLCWYPNWRPRVAESASGSIPE